MLYSPHSPASLYSSFGGSVPFVYSWRQRRLYTQHYRLWRFSERRSALGQERAKAWWVVVEDFKGYMEPRPSTKSLEGFLLVEVDNAEVVDKAHTVAAVPVQAGDVLEQLVGPEAGQCWAVRGDPAYHVLHANKQTFAAGRLMLRPNGIPE